MNNSAASFEELNPQRLKIADLTLSLLYSASFVNIYPDLDFYRDRIYRLGNEIKFNISTDNNFTG